MNNSGHFLSGTAPSASQPGPEFPNFYHICTDGLEDELIFKNEEDFIFGMNGVPVFAHKSGISILAFCLMHNHVHFVVKASKKACEDFIKAYRLRLCQISNASRADICIKEIEDDEYLRRAIAYVLRNPVSAKKEVLPTNYPWASGSVYFQPEMYFRRHLAEYRQLDSLSSSKVRDILRTKEPLPGYYLIDPYGMVQPGNYIDITTVEEKYSSVKNFLYYLSKNDDMEMEMHYTTLPKCRYDDEQLRASMLEICKKDYRVSSPQYLSVEKLHQLAVTLRRRYHVSGKQIARVTGLDPQLLRKVLPK